MPTPQDLERLRGLLTRLTAIGGARRGTLIRAEDWNALVLAVADIARAVLAVDPAAAVPPHEHLDQVSATWLTPALRTLLERGPLADPAMQKRLTDIEQSLRRTREKQDTNDQQVDEFRGRLTDVGARDLERAAAITSVRRTIDGIADPRPELQTMRTTIGVIQRDVSSVLEAASRLTVDGEVVDLGGVVTRVSELERLRERLRTANGELLDAATIEQRLAEVSTRAVSQTDLDEALRTRPGGLDAGALADLEGRLAGTLRGQVDGVLDTFRADVRADVGARLSAVDDVVAARVSDAVPGVTQSVEAALAGRIAAAEQAAVTAATAAAGRAIETATQDVRVDLQAEIGDLRSGLAGLVQQEVTQRLSGELAGLRTSIESLAGRLDTTAVRVAALDDVQRQHVAVLAALPQQLGALRGELRQAAIAEVDLRMTTVSRQMDERIAALERTQDDRFQSLSREVEARAVDEARRVAVETSRHESRALRTQLLAEVRGIAREEVTIAVRDQVTTSVRAAVDERFSALPGLVAAEVRRVGTISNPTPIVVPPVIGGGGR